MKNRTVILTSLLMAALLAGCGKDSSSDGSGAGNTIQVITEDQAASDASETDGSASEAAGAAADTADTSPEDAEASSQTQEGAADDSAYAGFTEGSVKALVDDGVELGYDDYDMNYVGKELSVDEIAQNLKDGSLAGISSLPSVSYKTFPGIDGGSLLAVKYTNVGIDGEGDNSTTVIVLSDKSGSLHITYCYNTWSRCEGYISDDGIFYSSGSDGAGDHCCEYGCFNADGSYQNIYSDETLFESWIGSAINEQAFEEAYGEGQDGSYTDMQVDIITMGDDTYYTYGCMDGEMSEADKKFIELTSECGWKSADEIDSLIQARCELLGVSQEKLEVGNFKDTWTDR